MHQPSKEEQHKFYSTWKRGIEESKFGREYAKYHLSDPHLEPSSLESLPESSSDIYIKFVERKQAWQVD